MKEIKKLSKEFGLQYTEVSPFSEDEILRLFLLRQVEFLDQALEHYPERAWVDITPGQIFGMLIDYAESDHTVRHTEKWSGWVQSAYLRQARRELRRLRRGQYWSTKETQAAVDKVLDLLSKAKAEPEEIETTCSELENLRKTAKYA
ncbi:MAG: hypothetical protein HY979_02965 [Candidatus Magasanikbacteria bacterium]|nr:hypothetical protein [Candidatus Magasanikbacteria bacterium]